MQSLSRDHEIRDVLTRRVWRRAVMTLRQYYWTGLLYSKPHLLQPQPCKDLIPHPDLPPLLSLLPLALSITQVRRQNSYCMII